MDAFTETEKKCLAAKCPYFVCWSYWGAELHSCQLQGQSDVIDSPADDNECLIKEG